MTADVVTVDRRTFVRWRRAIIAGFGIGGITIAAWGPRLPAIKAELGLSTAVIGLLLAGVTIGSLTGLVASTPVLHWLGTRIAVTGSLLTVSAALAAVGLALAVRSVPFLGIAFVFVGFGLGLLDVLINVEGAAIERAAGRTLMPLLHGAWSAGAGIGSGIGAACAALRIRPSTQFIAEAALIVVVALVIRPAIPAASHTSPAQPARARAEQVRLWLRGWTDWRLLLIGVVMLGVELGEGSANSWLVLAVRNDHGQAAAVAALFFTTFAVCEATARILGGPVVDRLGRVNTIRWTTALGIAGLLLFIVGHNWLVVLMGVVLWSVGVSMGFPLGTSAAAESGPNPVARVSVVSSIGYSANLAGPPAIGLLAQPLGLLGALWLVVALFLAAFAAAGSLRKEPVADSDSLTPATD